MFSTRFFTYLSLLVFLFIADFAFSQNIITLQSPISGTKEYKANQLIDCKPAFSYKANGTDFCHLMIEKVEDINTPPVYSTPISNSDIVTRNVDQNLTIGTIDGFSSVNGSGSASYTIPILIPKGTGGMEPKISIVYNSQTGSGLLGLGWNLAGISAITRTGQNDYYDQNISTINYTSSDKFLLDGSRIIPKDNQSVFENKQFTTEFENFTKITSHGSSSSGPDWFEIETKDGLVIEYGRDPRRRVGENGNTIMWLIDKMYDKSGNYLQYNYKIINSQKVIDNILYTGNSVNSLQSYNKIVFEYQLKADSNNLFYGVQSQVDNVLLKSIKTFSKNQLFNEYDFDYSNTTNSFLNKVTEKSSTGQSYNPTIFHYNNTIGVSYKNSNVSMTNLAIPQGIAKDFNNDGFTDFVDIQEFSNVFYIKSSINQKNSTFQTPQSTLYGLPSGVSQFQFLGSRDFQANKNSHCDINGDGYEDLVFISENQNSTNFWIFLNNSKNTPGSISFNTPILETVANNSTYPSDNKVLIGNFDGDNLTDIVLLTPQGTAVPYYSANQSSSLGVNQYSQAFVQLFKNGNFSNSINKTITFPHNINFLNAYPIDLNGDNIMEVAGIVSEGAYPAYFAQLDIKTLNSNINSFSPEDEPILDIDGGPAATNLYFSQPVVKFQGDFNGDGIIDLLYNTSKTTTDYKIAYGRGKDINGYRFYLKSFSFPVFQESPINTTSVTGENFASFTPQSIHDYWLANGVYPKHTITNSSTYKQTLFFINDFNGDGLTDIYYLFRNFKDETSITYRLEYDAFGRQMEVPVGSPSYNYAHLQFESRFISSNGISFSNPVNVGFYTTQNSNQGGLGNINESCFTGDFDGKGQLDILFYSAFNKYSQNYVPINRLLQFNRNQGCNRLAIVSNGLNHKTEFLYKSLTEPTVYTKQMDAIAPIFDVQIPIYVVQNLNKDNSIGGVNTETYSYLGAKVHNQKGFLGFMEISVTDVVNNIKSTNINQLENTTFSLLPWKTEIRRLDDNSLISSSENQTSVTTTSLPHNYIIKKDKRTVIDHIKATTMVTDIVYDNYLNPTHTVNDINNGLQKTTTDIIYEQHGTWVPASPSHITTQMDRSGQAFYSKRNDNTFNEKGEILTSTDFADKTIPVAFTYTYDVFGNVLTKTITASDIITKEIEMKYDEEGRFIVQSSNPLKQSTEYTYHPALGLPVQTKAINGLISQVEYDGFGRKTKDISPDGTTTEYSYKWAVAEVSNSVFTLEQNTSNAPSVKKWFSNLNQELQTKTDGFNQSIYNKTTYYANGQVFEKYNSYTTTADLKSTFTYDPLNRVSQIASPQGNTTYTYSLQSNGLYNVSVATPDGQTSSKLTDASNLLIKSTDNGGMIEYEYYSYGKAKDIKVNGTISNHLEYNDKLQQTKLSDSNAGDILYTYNSSDELVQQIDQKNNTIISEFDELGRIKKRTEAGGNKPTIYKYYDSGVPVNTIEKITEYNGAQKEFTYDNLGRVSTINEKADGENFTTSYTYGNNSQLKTVTYPGSRALKLEYEYDTKGFLTTIKDVNDGGMELFRLTETNRYGDVKNYVLGNGISTQKEYTEDGFLTSINALGIQSLEMDFDVTNGNLNSRIDNYKNLREDFTYDNLNRLIRTETTKLSSGLPLPSFYPALNISYALNGNITAKDDAGHYSYSGQKKNAVVSITNPQTTIPLLDQDITYTSFNSVEKITENKQELTFTYNDSRERIKTELKNTETGAVIYTRYFATDYEKTISPTGIEEVYYINSPDGLIAMNVVTNGISKMHYVYKDHLGSILAVTDENGTVEVEQNFDAWGRNRNPNNWTYIGIAQNPSWLYRGYTGHEHLTEFNLINMNGRLYDPVLGRMLSPDNFVQDATGTQGYNRYSYVFNNPLKFTDPTGQLTFLDILAGASIVTGAILIGTGVGAGIGAGLIGAGFSHFAYAYSGYHNGSSWNSASMNAGFSLSYSGNLPGYEFGYKGTPMETEPFYNPPLSDSYVDNYADDPNLITCTNCDFIPLDFDGTDLVPNPTPHVISKNSKLNENAPWMKIANEQLGQKEFDPGNNYVIIGYHSTTGKFKDDETPWCSSFVNWSMTQVGIRGTNSAKAYSWKTWGQELDKPAYGAIAVMNYSHVGFVAGINKDGRLILLGGNQGRPGAVNLSPNSFNAVLTYRYPYGYSPQYNLPMYDLHGRSLTLSSTR